MARRKSFLLRLSPELYGAVQGWAEEELRSMNAQIEFILREAVRRRTGLDPHAAPPPQVRGQDRGPTGE